MSNPTMNVSDLVGVIVLGYYKASNFGSKSVEEFKIIETSPSRNWVKVMDQHGRKFWRMVADISIVEILIDLKADRPHE